MISNTQNAFDKVKKCLLLLVVLTDIEVYSSV